MPVTIAQSATAHRTPTSISGAARSLLAGHVPTIQLDGLDLDRSLLGTASSVLSQLRLLSKLCSSSEHHTRIVLGIIDLANSFGLCSPAALGVSGVLVDRLREADEAQLAHVLASARTVFTDEELAAGAAALLAAATAFVADAVGVDPMVVHDEIHSSVEMPRNWTTRRFCGRAV